MRRVVDDVVQVLVSILIVVAITLGALALIGKLHCSVDYVSYPGSSRYVLTCVLANQ